MNADRRLRIVRGCLLIVVAGLVVSGVTAFPLVAETRLLAAVLHDLPAPGGLVAWVDRVHAGLAATGEAYPFIAYGTDWLAFAHLVIAVAFWGPLRDPVRNVWVVQFGVIACAAVVPLALVAGPVRGIPFGWQLIDISFGVLGVVPLLVALRHIRVLERAQAAAWASGVTAEA
ncbi:hypothetical protein [Spirilliplanes yamanashiensis]|nr:hypothetical protein [Spirilliplanes yamanashiensis]MDP9816337.1 hypothetical protein [Spirilliplanes yamanashiensis]